MILNCPKCKKQFALSAKCFLADGRIDLVTHDVITCVECGFIMPHAECIGQIRYGEFLEWVNAYNADLLKLKEIKRAGNEFVVDYSRLTILKPKSLWDVVVADKALRKILIGEEKLKETDTTPSLRFIVRSAQQPTRDFILGKFKEHLNEVYQYGYIDPFIQCTCMCIAADGKFFDI
jgi:hypothetical protein